MLLTKSEITTTSVNGVAINDMEKAITTTAVFVGTGELSTHRQFHARRFVFAGD